jgi:hypothetical protein
MMGLLRKIFSRGVNFSEAEKIILGSVRSLLQEQYAVLWDRQVNTINKIQRLPCGVEVDFYRMNRGQPLLDESIAFPIKEEEALLARSGLKVNGVDRVLTAEIWCVRGILFSIEYSPEVECFEEALTKNPAAEFSIQTDILLADLKS